jgi:hypothetical protein
MATSAVTGGPPSPTPTDRASAATEQPAPPSATRSAAAVRTPDPVVAVPIARLGSGEAGALGSYTFAGQGTDAPWLPARMLQPVPVRPGAAVEVRVEGVRIASWTARVAEASDATGATATGAGKGGPIAAGTAVTIDAPKSRGGWVLMVQVVFADEVGDAAYYWRLDVT